MGEAEGWLCVASNSDSTVVSGSAIFSDVSGVSAGLATVDSVSDLANLSNPYCRAMSDRG